MIFEQVSTHHRRKRKRHKTRNRDRAGESHRKFAKQRTRESALKCDRRINGRKRNGHRDNRAHEFARAEKGGLDWHFTFTDVALDIFDYHDGVVDHNTDGEDDR